MSETDIHHDPESQRFIDGAAYLAYRRSAPGVVDFVSVQVPPDRRGGGVAGKLTEAAFRWAEAEALKVRPVCPYVSGAFLKRNPHWQAHVAS